MGWQDSIPRIHIYNDPTLGREGGLLTGIHTVVDLRAEPADWQTPNARHIQIPGGCPVARFLERCESVWDHPEITRLVLDLRDGLCYAPECLWAIVCDCGQVRCAAGVIVDLISISDRKPNHRARFQFVQFNVTYHRSKDTP